MPRRAGYDEGQRLHTTVGGRRALIGRRRRAHSAAPRHATAGVLGRDSSRVGSAGRGCRLRRARRVAGASGRVARPGARGRSAAESGSDCGRAPTAPESSSDGRATGHRAEEGSRRASRVTGAPAARGNSKRGDARGPAQPKSADRAAEPDRHGRDEVIRRRDQRLGLGGSQTLARDARAGHERRTAADGRVAASRGVGRRRRRTSGSAPRGLSGASRLPGVGATRPHPGHDLAPHLHRTRWTGQRRDRPAIRGRSSAGPGGLRRRAALAVRAGAQLRGTGGDVGARAGRVPNQRSRVASRTEPPLRTAPPDRRIPSADSPGCSGCPARRSRARRAGGS